MDGIISEVVKNPRKAINVLKYRTDVQIGKILFKNTAGFSPNIRGILTKNKLKNHQLKFKTKNKFSDKFKLNGNVLIGQPYDNSLIEKLSNEFNRIIDDTKLSSVRAQNEGIVYSKHILELISKIPDVKKLISKQIIDIFEQYYDSHFQILDVVGWRNLHVPDEIIEKTRLYSDDWHCDPHNITQTKLFVYLTDVTEDDGPFFTQSIQSTKELIQKGFGSRNNPKLSQKVMENPDYATKYTGPKGTSLVANTTVCLHKATIPKKGHYRDIIQFFISPSSTPLTYEWPKILQKKYSSRRSKDKIEDLTIT